MEGFRGPTPFARLAAGVLGDEQFTLLDIGCSSGIDAIWRIFGDNLRAFAFDPNIDEIARLRASETLPNVKYVAAFVGVPDEDPGAGRMRSGDFWGRNPWGRLSVYQTQQIRDRAATVLDGEQNTKRNLWTRVPLADREKPVIIPTFLREQSVTDVDFIKIDVDGPDFLILRSFIELFSETNVLGVGIEVNFNGTDDPNVHALHNVDRLLKKHGFELFSLSSRPYSMAALPAPYQLPFPAQSTWGRILQGDALYLRDAASPEYGSWSESVEPVKLLKLAVLFSLTGLPDCGAEILVRYRTLLDPMMDVQAGLDALTEQCIPDGPPVTYAEYMAEFESDGKRFYPAAVGAPAPVAAAIPKALVSETSAEIARLHEAIASLKASRSWKLTAPLRGVGEMIRLLHPRREGSK